MEAGPCPKPKVCPGQVNGHHIRLTACEDRHRFTEAGPCPKPKVCPGQVNGHHIRLTVCEDRHRFTEARSFT